VEKGDEEMRLVTVKMHWGEGAWHSELIDAEFANNKTF